MSIASGFSMTSGFSDRIEIEAFRNTKLWCRRPDRLR